MHRYACYSFFLLSFSLILLLAPCDHLPHKVPAHKLLFETLFGGGNLDEDKRNAENIGYGTKDIVHVLYLHNGNGNSSYHHYKD